MIAAQYGLDTVEADVAAVPSRVGAGQQPGHPCRSLLRRHRHHSAGTDDRVAGLVYIAALAPDEAETSRASRTVPHHRRLLRHRDRERAHLAAAGRRRVLRGRPVRRGAEARLGDRSFPPPDLFTQKVEASPGVRSRAGTSWPTRSHRQSRPGAFVANRMGATTYEFESSHVPMLSNPDLVIDVIRTAANAVEASLATA